MKIIDNRKKKKENIFSLNRCIFPRSLILNCLFKQKFQYNKDLTKMCYLHFLHASYLLNQKLKEGSRVVVNIFRLSLRQSPPSFFLNDFNFVVHYLSPCR